MADIIGLSCRFPESNGPSEFWSNLMNGKDMVTADDRRWPVGFQGLPPRTGKLPGFDKFDAAFFSVHGKQAQKMDPQLRKLLEVSYEAWVDAGVDFSSLRGSDRVGVYVGACGSETHAQWLGDIPNITGYEQTGCAQSMFPNRLSWWFDFRGPSKCIDTACSSSLMAFNDAMTDLTTGRIDYAVVGGASGIFRPQTSIAFQRLHMMSPDGTCKSFDASANGYARADGIAIVVLRKAGLKEQIGTWAARQPYAQVLACATNNDGHTKEGITFPSGPAQKALAQEVCAKAGLEPSAISYIEAHGTGTVAGDGQELGALEEWYGRAGARTAEDPLLIGSVKSNMGHCEGCSGLAALIKVLLSYEHQTLPGNLHFNTPNPNNAGLKDGILKVVTEPTEFKQGIVALSNFGFGGSNVHLLLKNYGSSEPKPSATVTEIPEGEQAETEASAEENAGATSEIIPLATRTKEGMAALVKVLKGLPGGEKTVVDPLRRLANTVGRDSKLSTRGTLIDGELRSAQGPSSAPPVWFVFTGNGSQWPKMGRELLETNATFCNSIEICAKALQPYGVDLLAAYESEDGFGEARTAAVGLASIQIGLVDVLREEYGITPGGVLGHSAGEIACGYGDGCFTREQTVLVAYHRGRMCPEHNISGGLMAAVGLGADEAAARLAKHGKDSCVVGCDNSPNSVTLSGPEEDIKPLLEQLKAEGVFVRELDTRGLAFHSPVLQPHLGELKEALESVVPEPKQRSATWLSSTYAVDDESEEAKYCSGGYQTHGYASRVQFRLACTKIPKDVLLLEIGPHALMRSPLRQNRSDLQYVATMKKGENAVETLKAAVADLWRKGAIFSWPASGAPSAGAHPELFRAVREALVSWDHSADYPLPKSKDWTAAGGSAGFTKTYKLGEEHSFLADHVVDGRILMPATSYLVTAWEALAAQQETTMEEMPVIFEDVSIVQAVQAQPGENVTLSVLLDRSHRFQVLQETDIIAEGRIKARTAPAAPKKAEEDSKDESAEAPGDTVAPPQAAAPAEAAAPAAEAPNAEPTAAEGAAAPAPAEEAAPAEPTTVDWPYDVLDTVEAGTFYLDVARAGIQYGPHFKMVHKRHIDGKHVVLRWDGCFIRLLDGMLQAGALGSTDYQLRIPTKIRHLEILDAKPALPAGSEMMVDVDADVGVSTTECCTVAGVELSSAPRRPINFKTLLKKMDFVPYGENRDADAQRLAYYKQVCGYIKARVEPAIEAVRASSEEFPEHLKKILVMLEDFHDPCPEGAELEAFLAHPKHHLARLIRDLFADEAAATTMENPIQAIVQHSEHNVLYAQDPLMQGFHSRHISHMLDIVCENQGQTGFTVAEVGAGTGGFTRQVIAELDRSPFSELRSYTATDITPAFGPNLLQLVNNSKLEFKTWDVNKPAPESLGGPFNLMLASNAVHTCDNMAETLSNIHASLADGGFLMLYETTAAYTTCLWGLDERTWNFTDEREYGLWIAKPRWDRLWADAGFQQVIAHWCPQESGALFLYRKLEKVPEPVLLAAPPVKVTNEDAEEFIKTFNETLESVDPETIAKAAAPAEGAEPAEPAAELLKRAAWLHGNLRDNPGVLGLGHCARLERFGDNLRWMLDANHPSAALTNAGSKGAQPALSAQQMLVQAGKLDLVNNVFQNGVHGSLRNTIVELDEVNQAAAEGKKPAFGVHLDIASYGDMSSFFWAHSQPPPPGLIECDVAYGSLNFRDIMLAYGKLSKDLMSHGHGGHQIGLEFSGKDKSSGKRIMGMTPQNSIATMVASKPHALWAVPDNWTLAQGATVPVAYATAYDALVVRGRLQPQHRVLIHSATGAVGLAATRICLNRGCEVFVTCGTADKRAFLLEAFPTLREDHMGDSRSCSFEETVKRQTAGKGVHLALNSLADDKLQATVRCLADNGRLLEIGKYDILKGTPLSMRPMLRNCAFEGIDLDRIVNDPSNITEAWEVHALLAAGIASGEVVPLPLNRFERKEAGNAFRFMAAGTHMGKVLIQMAADADKETLSAGAKAVFKWPAPPKKAEEQESEEAAPAPAAEAAEPSATPVFFCKEDRSYIITGGLGGFGLALAVWLSNQGAKNLVMTSKRGMRTGGQRKVIEMLRSRGVNVEVSKLDVADMEEAKGVVALAEKQAPVGGIFHLAMILQDRWMANQTGDSWNAPIIPKAYGALNLDALSDGLPNLEQFVIFSSVVSSTGNEGQGNYGYANSVCDMLCMSRRAAGKPALAIAWGPVDHVGYVAEILKGKLVGRVFEWLLPQPVDDCLRVLSSCLLGGKNVTPLMCSTTETIGNSNADDGEDTDLVEAVLNLMGLKADAVGENDNLAALGIDSMQLMEVRAVMQKKLCRPIPLEMIGSLTVATLRELAAEAGSKGGRSSAPPADEAAAPEEASAPAEEPQKEEEPKLAAVVPPQTQQQLAAKKAASVKEISITAHAERPRKSQVSGKADKADTSRADDVSAPPAAPLSTPSAPASPPTVPTSPPTVPAEPRPASASRPSSAKAETANKASVKAEAAATQTSWTTYTAGGLLYIGVVLALIGFPAAQTATWAASTFGVWALLPVLPTVWLGIGAALCVACVATARLFQPRLSTTRPISMYSLEFAQWWLVSRLVNVTTYVFADHLRGTPFLTWWFRAMGARIGEGCHIDTLDVCDFELVTLGDKVVLNEGSSIIGHYFQDGMLHFKEVELGNGARLEPFAMAKAGMTLAAGASIAPQSSEAVVSAAAAKKRGGRPAPVLDALSKQIHSRALSASETAYLQVAGLWAVGFTATLAAVGAYFVLGGFLYVAGLPAEVALSPAAYAVFSLAALFNPLYAAILPLLLPSVTPAAAAATLATVTSPLFAIFVAVFVPLAMILFGLNLTALSVAFKWAVAGKVDAGVHKHHSVRGVQLWTASRMVELTFKRFAMLCSGTWAMNYYLRALGAKIGNWSTFRLGLCLPLLPDSMDLGSGVHVGDMANLVYSYAVDSDSSVTAPVRLEDHALIGAAAVAMPGTTLGKGSTLGAMAASLPGAQLPGEMLYMGSPAQPVFKSAGSEKPAGPKQEKAKLMFQTWPLVQPAIAFGISTLSTYITAVAALASVALYGGALQSSTPLLLAVASGLWALYGTLLGCLGAAAKWSFTGKLEPHAGFPMYDSLSFRRALVLISEIPLGPFAEAVRASPIYNVFARLRGMTVGKGAYLDSVRLLDYELASFGDNAIVSRNALVYCHLASHKKGKLVIYQKRSSFGADSVLGTRSITLPGYTLADKATLAPVSLGAPAMSF